MTVLNDCIDLCCLKQGPETINVNHANSNRVLRLTTSAPHSCDTPRTNSTATSRVSLPFLEKWLSTSSGHARQLNHDMGVVMLLHKTQLLTQTKPRLYDSTIVIMKQF